MKNKLSIINYQFSINKSGFTLIELMAVVAIIMILAGILIPNVAKQVERGREGRAYADIDVLVKAVNLFQVDNGYLPSNLVDLWSSEKGGPYIASKEDLTDPWGNPYGYEKDGSSFTISATTKTGKIISKTITFGVSGQSTQ